MTHPAFWNQGFLSQRQQPLPPKLSATRHIQANLQLLIPIIKMRMGPIRIFGEHDTSGIHIQGERMDYIMKVFSSLVSYLAKKKLSFHPSHLTRKESLGVLNK